jgi:hypothetical protein
MRGQLASLPPATTPTPPHGVEKGPSSSRVTCQGSDNTTTAPPALDPAASRMLELYLACVAARGWCRMVLETRGGAERFDFSSRPTNSTSDNSSCSQHPAAKQSAKRRPNARKHEREKQRRITWVERRRKRAKGTGGPAPADTAKGSKAAAAVASKAAAAALTAAVTTAADKRATAAANSAAAAPTAAVATSYSEAVKATLPSAAAPRAAAARLTRAAAKKEVAVATGSAEAVTSPSPPAPPAKRKRRRQQQSEPTGGMEEMGEERLCAIPQLDGDSNVSVCSEPAAQPSSPASATSTSPSASPPPSPSSPAEKKCSDCNINDLFNYDFKNCRDCLKKLICSKCYSESKEYHLKYSFKYILDYCQAECSR